MLLGCVVRHPGEAEHADGLPLDYLELKGDMLCVDEDSFTALSSRLRATGLPLAAMTSPLPRRFGCRVVGPEADPTAALAVFTSMCDRAASLGVRTIVLGSGQARSIPPGFSTADGARQFRDFLAEARLACAERAMALTLEPLHSGETNFVNSCRQARAVADEAGVQLTVDCFHILSEGLSVEAELTAAAGVVGHAHTSSIPRGGGDLRVDVQARFVAGLAVAGYAGGLSIEDEYTDFQAESAVAVQTLRAILDSESR